MKITVCQMQAVWRMVQSFHTEILDQVSRRSSRAQGALSWRRITASLRRLGTILLLVCRKLFSVTQYFGGKCESMFRDVHWQNKRRAS